MARRRVTGYSRETHFQPARFSADAANQRFSLPPLLASLPFVSLLVSAPGVGAPRPADAVPVHPGGCAGTRISADRDDSAAQLHFTCPLSVPLALPAHHNHSPPPSRRHPPYVRPRRRRRAAPSIHISFLQFEIASSPSLLTIRVPDERRAHIPDALSRSRTTCACR